MKKYTLVILTFFITLVNAEIPSNVIEKAKKSSVKISSEGLLMPYDPMGRTCGSGFLVNKQQGYIVTNHHVVANGIVNYEVTFENGKITDAKLLYYDIWQDFAVLKVDPAQVPANAIEVEFAESFAKYGQEVFIMHTGYITNTYDIEGILPQQCYTVNFLRAGGRVVLL